MIIIKIWGGIGNQLFQYVFGQYLKYKYNHEIRYDCNSYYIVDTNRKKELDELDTTIVYDNRCCFSKYSGIKNRLLLYTFLMCPKHHFVKESSPMPKKIEEEHVYFFQGYWQDIKYYQWLIDNYDFRLNIKTMPIQLLRYVEILKNMRHSVSVHVRRGDYFSPKNVNTYGVCDELYFQRAIRYIESNVSNPHFFFFTDDIEWVKNHINNMCNDGNYTIIANYDVPQLSYIMLMSLCRHHIISNSTFSWWGTVLDSRKDGIVVSPQIWILGSEKTLALDNWKKMEV